MFDYNDQFSFRLENKKSEPKAPSEREPTQLMHESSSTIRNMYLETLHHLLSQLKELLVLFMSTLLTIIFGDRY